MIYPSNKMDEYIEQILAEMSDSALRDVVRNILDEPIPEAVKRRLLRPLQPRKYRPIPLPRRAKERKRKAIQEEFDPIPRQKVYRSVGDFQKELQGLFEEPEEHCLYRRPTNFTTPGSRTSTVSSTTRTKTGGRSTSASVASMGTHVRICWKPTGRSARESGRRLCGWRCPKRARTSSPSRTTTSSCPRLTLSTPTSKPSPRKSKGRSSTRQKATPRGHNTTRHAVTATWWYGATGRQRRPSNTGGATRQNTSSELSKRKSVGSRKCWRTRKT